jgi:hypothetical protein
MNGSRLGFYLSCFISNGQDWDSTAGQNRLFARHGP